MTTAPLPGHPNAAWMAQRPSWPYFCEENVAWLCRDAPWPMYVVVVGNPSRSVAMWASAFSERPDGLIVWDYHVVAVGVVDERALCLDHACATGTVLPLAAWLNVTFRSGIAAPFCPRFRVCAGDDYLTALRSDRRHMRDDNGACLRPFPPWPGPQAQLGSNVLALTSFNDDDDDGGADDFAADDLDGVDALAAAFGLGAVDLPFYVPLEDVEEP